MVVRSTIAACFLVAVAAWTAAATDIDGMEAAVRQALESELQKGYGIGFSSFECDIDEDIAPGGRFDCQAVDESGDRMAYTIGIGEDGEARVILVSQPASQLSPTDREILEPPCRAFLDDFSAENWTALYAALDPSLREAVTADAAQAMLEPVRSVLGAVKKAELQTHAVHESGRHELVYRLDCEQSPGEARFGIVLGDGGARLTAFVITPAPGSSGQAVMLEAVGRDMLSGLIGEKVVRVNAPFADLRELGDAVEGTAWLEDGRDLPIRAVQSGRKDDFDPVDYRFQVLDVPWLLRHMLEAKSRTVESVDCPQRVVADGQVVSCTVTTDDGTLIVTLQRQGGNYRVVESARSETR
jgi:hypothetical protein